MANLRVRQAADYLSLSKSFLDKARCYGGGPAYSKLGASIIYSTDDLDEWRTANRRSDNDNDAGKQRARAA